ncbi:hypothetical protein GE061_019052 [Apolygus lucorum]|uniref:Uncharacterized protein n=1 Tax=Apolygus lucorum TaxID=248454 RepID=A0A6A4JP19_APOLU|nr:hypothetical protein GE061_019052 [Apolygus lucorum]
MEAPRIMYGSSSHGKCKISTDKSERKIKFDVLLCVFEVTWQIFSSLSLEELCRARAVCRAWWDLVNCDLLWKPKLLERRITNDYTFADTQGDARTLRNCEWANTCFKYYSTAIRNWDQKSPRVSGFSAEVVFVYLPYMLTLFKGEVEVHRLSNGSFEPWGKILLPQDAGLGGPEIQMSCPDTFAVSKEGYVVIFKLREGSVYFEKVIAFADDTILTSCSDESKAPGFVRDTYDRRPDGIVECQAVFQDVVWLRETYVQVVVVWDYVKCEEKLRFDLSDDFFKIHAEESRVFFIHKDEVSIYSPHGLQLWSYKHDLLENLSFCSNQVGCGFIEGSYDCQH